MFPRPVRDALTVPVLLAALTWAAGAPAAPAQSGESAVARGVVYEDANANGTRDAGEAGIEGVRLSNGRDIVETDRNGAYRLSLEEGDVLFVVKPSDYALPTDEDGLPQFYYIHDPDGSPADLPLRYEGIRPTGALPERIDFPLLPRAEPRSFSFLAFSDPQPQTESEIAYIRDRIVAPLIGTDALFGVTTGDIMYDDLSLLPRYNRIIGRIGVPWFNVPGNHELNFQSPDDRHSLETFKRIYGPADYAFSVGGVHFVVLDNVNYKGLQNGLGRDGNAFQPRQEAAYEGRLSPAQLEWLQKELSFLPPATSVVLLTHIPLRTPTSPENPAINTVNLAELFAVLSRFDHRYLALSGHTHSNFHLRYGQEHGFTGEPLHQHTLATVSGSWWSGPRTAEGVPMALQADGVPNGWHSFSVENGIIRGRYVPAGHDPDMQMRITVDAHFHGYEGDADRDDRPGAKFDGHISRDHVFAARILANVFNAAPEAEVTLQVGAREPVTMTRVTEPDPTSRELIQRFPETYKDFIQPWPTTHLWTARLPADLPAGAHILTVRAIDAYGTPVKAHKVIEVFDYQ